MNFELNFLGNQTTREFCVALVFNTFFKPQSVGFQTAFEYSSKRKQVFHISTGSQEFELRFTLNLQDIDIIDSEMLQRIKTL